MGIPDMIGPLGERTKSLNPAFSDFAGGGPTKINSTNNMVIGPEDDIITQTITGNKQSFIAAGGGSKLEYPLDVTGNPAYAATVKFQIFEYAMPNEGDTAKNHSQSAVDNLAGSEKVKAKVEENNLSGIDGPANAAARFAASAYSDDAANANVRNPGFQFVDDAAVTQSFVKTKSEDEADNKNNVAASTSQFKIGFQKKIGSPSIVMNFPISQTFMDTIGYTNADLNSLGGAVEGAAQAGDVSIKNALKAALGNVSQNIIDVVSDPSAAITGAAKSDAARVGASRIMGKAPFGVGTAATLLNRMIVNPNTRTLFTGVTVREFAFQFKFISTSPEEGEVIQKIIKTFRKEAYPETFNIPIGGESSVAYGYNFPNAFKITFNFKGAENQNIPKILPCYLRSISHTINPTGGGFRNDGKANEIDLSLAFTEFRALQSQDIEKGF